MMAPVGEGSLQMSAIRHNHPRKRERTLCNGVPSVLGCEWSPFNDGKGIRGTHKLDSPKPSF